MCEHTCKMSGFLVRPSLPQWDELVNKVLTTSGPSNHFLLYNVVQVGVTFTNAETKFKFNDIAEFIKKQDQFFRTQPVKDITLNAVRWEATPEPIDTNNVYIAAVAVCSVENRSKTSFYLNKMKTVVVAEGKHENVLEANGVHKDEAFTAEMTHASQTFQTPMVIWTSPAPPANDPKDKTKRYEVYSKPWVILEGMITPTLRSNFMWISGDQVELSYHGNPTKKIIKTSYNVHAPGHPSVKIYATSLSYLVDTVKSCIQYAVENMRVMEEMVTDEPEMLNDTTRTLTKDEVEFVKNNCNVAYTFGYNENEDKLGVLYLITNLEVRMPNTVDKGEDGVYRLPFNDLWELINTVVRRNVQTRKRSIETQLAEHWLEVKPRDTSKLSVDVVFAILFAPIKSCPVKLYKRRTLYEDDDGLEDDETDTRFEPVSEPVAKSELYRLVEGGTSEGRSLETE